ncbi:MAG: DMT family transporter, partial [Actinomycetota bacterium]|nr:DMT family transporter [Actinomycetota bacterium]
RSIWVVLIVAAIGWGTGGIAVRAAYGEGIGPWTLVALRVGIAAILVIALLAVKGLRFPDRLTLKVGFVMAITNLLIPYVLFTFAYNEASAGFVGLFAALIPLATAVYANFMLDNERLTRGKLVGLFIGFSGVAALLVSGDSGLGAEGRPLVAAVLALISVVAIGYAGAYAKRYAGQYDPIEITGIQFALSAVILIPAMLMFEGIPSSLTAPGWALILYMAVASTFLPFYLYYRLLESMPATTVSLIGYLVPLVSLIGGVLLLEEHVEAGIVVGGALILTGMVVTDRADRPRTPAISD